jgi:hypothetical protein
MLSQKTKVKSAKFPARLQLVAILSLLYQGPANQPVNTAIIAKLLPIKGEHIST